MELPKPPCKWIAFFIIYFLSLHSWSQISDVETQSPELLFESSVKKTLEKKYYESALILKQLIKKNPEKSIYWFNFSNNLFMLGRYKAALKYYDKVISLNTKFVDAAKLYKIKTIMAMGLLSEAEVLIQKYLAELPKPTQIFLLKAEQDRVAYVRVVSQKILESYKAENYNQVQNLAQQLEPNTISYEAKILQILSLYKLEKYNEARAQALLVKKYFHLNENKKDMVNELLLKTAVKISKEKEINYFAKFESGYSDNIFIDGESVESLTSAIVRAEAYASYLVYESQFWNLKLGYNLFYEYPLEAKELQTLYHNFDLNWMYEQKSFSFNVKPQFQIQNWNNKNEIQKASLEVTADKAQGSTSYGLSLVGSAKKALTASYDYLSGTDYTLSPFVGLLTESAYSEVYLMLGKDGVGDIHYADGSSLPLANNFYGMGVKLNYEVEEQHVFLAQISYINRNFENKAQPSQEKRIDQQIGASLQYAYNFLPSLKFNVTLENVRNKSTLGATEVRDKNYNANYYSIGITWRGN